MNKVFNLLYKADECVPIFEGFIAILCIINETFLRKYIGLSGRALDVILTSPEERSVSP